MKKVEIREEQLFLHWQKAVWWPKQKLLLVADTHFAKDSVFRQHGIAIPAGSSRDDLQRLSHLIEQTQAERLIVLGDFVHAQLKEQDPFLTLFKNWQNQYKNLSFEVVTGNHDQKFNRQFLSDILWHEHVDIAPFKLQHEPSVDKHYYVIAGHIHPVVRVGFDRADRIMLPVFIYDDQCAILPSFGKMTGGHKIKPKAKDGVYAFGEQDVLKIQ